jgi:KDO2-lipid IV(A) lauroyltransferase
VVAREPEDPLFGAYVRRMRESAGFAVLGKGSSARELLAVLRRGEMISLLPDQNSGDLFVPFFGVPVGTVAGPASLALHTGATLLPCYCVRRPDDTYEVLFFSPIPSVPMGDRQADLVRITGEVNRVLEQAVRRYPDQWLWLHNRWRSAFEEKNRARWPEGFDYEAARALWLGERPGDP